MHTTNNTSHPLRTIVLTILITLIVAVVVGYVFGVVRFSHSKKTTGQKSSTENNMSMSAQSNTAKPGQRKILYWRAPMNPKEIYNHPGKSAMGMDLVPVYEDAVSGGATITIDPVIQQDMGVRMAKVTEGPLTYTIRTYGHITYDETRLARIAPKFNGWIEKLYVDFTGQKVDAGQPLFDIYSPELVTAQEEYLAAYKSRKGTPGSDNLLDTVKRRLLFYDIAESEIRQIEKLGHARRTITVRSPFSGIVTEKHAVEGGYVMSGETVYQIADLSRVWVEAHIYEYELPMVREGLTARMTLPYLPGKTYTGQVAFVYPYLQRKTRDVVIRLTFDNPDLELKPDMYADVFVKTVRGDSGMMIPSEAVLRTGERNIVFVSRGDGKFTPREVQLGGALDNHMLQILSGLATGETIVTSGQFMLDSESSLKEAVQKMMEVKSPDQGMQSNMKMDSGMKMSSENQKPSGIDMKSGKKSTNDFFNDMESGTKTGSQMDMKSGTQTKKDMTMPSGMKKGSDKKAGNDFFSDME